MNGCALYNNAMPRNGIIVYIMTFNTNEAKYHRVVLFIVGKGDGMEGNFNFEFILIFY